MGDLMYMQHLLHKIRPTLVIETGAYKGGLTYFLATLVEMLAIDGGQVVSVDRHHPTLVHDAHWFCPVCNDCIKTFETPVWDRKVTFLQGYVDAVDVYGNILARVEENAGKGPVLITLDANHEFEGVWAELLLYAPMVSVGSFLIVQDAKLDRPRAPGSTQLWEKPAVYAAVKKFLDSTYDYVWDRDIEYYAYSQHMYLRRVKETLPLRKLEEFVKPET